MIDPITEYILESRYDPEAEKKLNGLFRYFISLKREERNTAHVLQDARKTGDENVIKFVKDNYEKIKDARRTAQSKYFKSRGAYEKWQDADKIPLGSHSKTTSADKILGLDQNIAIGIGVALLVGSAVAVGIVAYKKFFSQAAKACKGRSGNDKENCINSFKSKAAEHYISAIQNKKKDCKETKNPKQCIQKMDSKINKLKAKIKKYKSKLKEEEILKYLNYIQD